MTDFSTNQRMSIQEIGQRIERAIALHKQECIGTEIDVQLFQLAFDGHPLYKIVKSAFENDHEGLSKIAKEMKEWK